MSTHFKRILKLFLRLLYGRLLAGFGYLASLLVIKQPNILLLIYHGFPESCYAIPAMLIECRALECSTAVVALPAVLEDFGGVGFWRI